MIANSTAVLKLKVIKADNLKIARSYAKKVLID